MTVHEILRPIELARSIITVDDTEADYVSSNYLGNRPVSALFRQYDLEMNVKSS